MVNRKKRSILRLVDLRLYSSAQLSFEWRFLNQHKDNRRFPGQRPIGFYDISDHIKALELSYVEGQHPRVNRPGDFHVYGRTLGIFHRLTLGKQEEGLPAWNAGRVIAPFSSPLLQSYFTEPQMECALETIAKVQPIFEQYWKEGSWLGIVHSDTHKHNLIVNGDRGYLIDFAECGTGVLFWDLGVATVDTEMDYPAYGKRCNRELVNGYLSIIPEAKPMIEAHLDVFKKMRVLEVMGWPVTSWTEAYRVQNEARARKLIKGCVDYLNKVWR